MASCIQEQPSSVLSRVEQNPSQTKPISKATPIIEQLLSTRNIFPKGLRGGGVCFDCLACLCCCCALEEIACFECLKDC
ncbi:unnamed protein product [Rotaria sordida]|uniref:Cysteine-rich transmembrane CYSTM domain-containing protein n=1 Tax=Rotaria sordida TaxID=392033 RepID=A0A813UFD5_9BILA|nr:unnamed protein product [Rotaria sordida]CAF0835103.1 unnamed protein product [Rotaria sordida]CAF0870982.1 unnamed protein product [Rotaria sordida]